MSAMPLRTRVGLGIWLNLMITVDIIWSSSLLSDPALDQASEDKMDGSEITTAELVEVLDEELVEAIWIEDMFGEAALDQLVDDWCRAQHTVDEIVERQRLAGVEIAPVATNRPVTNSSESPGRKNPISRPHSAKMIRQTPISANGPRDRTMFSGSSQAGSRARVDVCAASTIAGSSVVTPAKVPCAHRRTVGGRERCSAGNAQVNTTWERGQNSVKAAMTT